MPGFRVNRAGFLGKEKNQSETKTVKNSGNAIANDELCLKKV